MVMAFAGEGLTMSEIILTDADQKPRSAAFIIKPGDDRSVEARRRLTSYWIRKIMLNIAADDALLHQVVADGPYLWRTRLIKECQPAGLYVDESVADRIFAFFCRQVRRRFWQERGRLPRHTPEWIAKRYLDVTPPPPKPPTMRDIIDSLEIDHNYDDDARRELYGRDGSPQRSLEIMKGEMRDALDVSGELPKNFRGKPA